MEDFDDVEDGLTTDGAALVMLLELVRTAMTGSKVAALVEDDISLLAQADHAKGLVCR